MKAAVYTRYGAPDVVTIRDVAKPMPKADEVLIRIRATTVSSGDWRMRSLEMPRGFALLARPAIGLFGPRKTVLGAELAGDVEAVGANVRTYKPGDAVVAFPGIGLGCHAEYRTIRETGAIAHKPANLSYEEAAALSFGGSTALDYLTTKGNIRRGDTVLIVGASGAVGSAAVQIAKHYGADVTGICSAANRALVLSLGARRTIDYAEEDFTRNGETYDIILDAAGTTRFARCQGSLKDKGRLLLVLSGLPALLQIPWIAMTSDKRVVAGPAAENPADLATLCALAREGAYRPVIDRSYPLERIVEAHRYVDTGRKKGSVVITLA